MAWCRAIGRQVRAADIQREGASGATERVGHAMTIVCGPRGRRGGPEEETGRAR